MVAWHKEMANATRATGRTVLGKLATDDASPPRSPFFRQMGESQTCPLGERALI